MQAPLKEGLFYHKIIFYISAIIFSIEKDSGIIPCLTLDECKNPEKP
jgi:hypothetical protein